MTLAQAIRAARAQLRRLRRGGTIIIEGDQRRLQVMRPPKR
jgi:hypothetical protein